MVVDGATTFVTAFDPRTKESHETGQCLLEWMDTFHCAPNNICVDMDFRSTDVQDIFDVLALNLVFHRTLYTMAESSRSSSSCVQVYSSRSLFSIAVSLLPASVQVRFRYERKGREE